MLVKRLMTVMVLAVWVAGHDGEASVSPYVSMNFRDAAGAERAYDVVLQDVRMFTLVGAQDFSLGQIAGLEVDEDGEGVLTTSAGEVFKGKLITKRLKHVFFDQERTLELEPSRPFSLRAGDIEGEKGDISHCLFLTLIDGSRFYVREEEQRLRVVVDAAQYNLELGSFAQVSFMSKSAVVQPGSDALGCRILYAGGGRLDGMVVNPFSTLAFRDIRGRSLSVPIRQIARIDGVQRDLQWADGSDWDVLEGREAQLVLQDGREEAVRIPFGVWSLRRRGDGPYEIPSAVVRQMEADGAGGVILRTVLGDELQGVLAENSISLIPLRGSGEPLDVAVASVKRLSLEHAKFEPKEDGGLFFLETSGVRLTGCVVDEIRMNAGRRGESWEISQGELLALWSTNNQYAVWLKETNFIAFASDRSASWYSLIDGKTRSFRWRDITRIERLGDKDFPEGFGRNESGAGVEDDGEGQPDLSGVESVGGNVIHPRIAPGHVLQVVVLLGGVKEIDEPARRVSSRGEISLPLLGALRVSGMTLEEVSEQLTAKYHQYFRNPLVVVQFTKDDTDDAISPWGFVTVLGTVKTPGKVNIPPTLDLTVSMAIQQAGGFGPSARDTAIRITRPQPDGGSRQFDVNLRRAGSRGEMENDMLLHPGDIVFVPEMIF